MKYSKEETDAAYANLLAAESSGRFSLAIVTGVLVSFVAFVSLAVFLEIAPVWLVPAIVGGSVGLAGNVFSRRYRIITGLVGTLLYLLSLFVFERGILILALTPIAFALSYYLAKKKLSKVEKTAIWLNNLEK